MSVQLLVIGVVEPGSDVLLVRQATAAGPGTVWALPGGRVARGELSVEALVRETTEETGLTIGDPCRDSSASATWSTPPRFSGAGTRFQPRTVRRPDGPRARRGPYPHRPVLLPAPRER